MPIRYARRAVGVMLAGVALGLGACRDSAAPEPTADVALNVATLEGPTIAFATVQRMTVSCTVTLRALATGDGVAEWQGGRIRFFAGRDRSEAADTLVMSADETASLWEGAEIEGGSEEFTRFVLSASVPFAITLDFDYLPAPRADAKTASASFACGPTLPDGAARPAVTSVTVRPGSGSIEPGTTIAVDYEATSEIGVVQAMVRVSGACQASDSSAFLLKKSISDTRYLKLPNDCILGAALIVEVFVVDGALEVASHELIAPFTLADLTAPTVTPSFVPRAAASGTPHPEGDYFVGDTIEVFFNAVDNRGIAALVWEAVSTGVRDSIPVASVAPVRVRIPIDESWGAGPVRLRLYAWDRSGFMSNVYTSPDEIRIHPTVVRPVRSTGVDGGISELAIDSDRGLAYLMQIDDQRIAIFSLATMSVTGYIDLDAHLGDLDLAPGGDTLVVTLPAQKALAIIDLTGAAPVVSTFPLTILDPVTNDVPVRVRVLAGGRVFVGLEGTAQPVRRVAEVNLATNSQRMLPEPPFAGGGVFERSHDRSAVVFRGFVDHLQRYDVSSDQFGPTRAVPAMWYETRPSVDAQGERIAFGWAVYDRTLSMVSQVFRLPNAALGPAAISPSGEVLYVVSFRDGILRYRASDGAILDRTPNPVRAHVIRVTSDGQWLITHGIGGISVIDLR